MWLVVIVNCRFYGQYNVHGPLTKWGRCQWRLKKIWPQFSPLISACRVSCKYLTALPLHLYLSFFIFSLMQIFLFLLFLQIWICWKQTGLISTNLYQISATAQPHQLTLQLLLQHSIKVLHPVRANHIRAAPTGCSDWTLLRRSV